MSNHVVLDWTSLATCWSATRRNSRRFSECVTKQKWYVELNKCRKKKGTVIRLCLVPPDALEMHLMLTFGIYLKKHNTELGSISKRFQFSTFKLKSEWYSLPISFKNINEDVKLKVVFGEPLYKPCQPDEIVQHDLSSPISLTSSATPEYKSWQSFLSFLKTGEFSDMIVAVDGKEIKCHKSVLCYGSNYFDRMFKSNLSESIDNKIDIVDFDYETIDAMITYLYTFYAPRLSFTLAKNLQKAANKYQILDLKDICEQQLISEITTENAMDLLLHADIYSADKVKDRVTKFILSNWKNFKEKEHYEPLMIRPDLLRDLMIAKAKDDDESVAERQTNQMFTSHASPSSTAFLSSPSTSGSTTPLISPRESPPSSPFSYALSSPVSPYSPEPELYIP